MTAVLFVSVVPTAAATRPVLLAMPIEPSQMILLGLLLVVTLSMLWSVRRKPKPPRFNREDFQREKFSAMKNRQGMEGDLQELIIELEELSRRINAQIDTKFVKLETTIHHADERIEALRTLIQKAGGQGGVDVIVDADADASSTSATAGVVSRVDPKHVQVYAMADADKSPVEIARETGIPTGEVELILALRDQ